ncbi:G-protein coupled receptor GRL101-like isoform X2 [Lytechinus variegatus]|uniref:G-protein coupled receptor GRL101-like isoform X2 n=1 Tax=Lytechinus variegatus TaxID=7654 RepID=UPI001BB2B7F5|nr:G-protein coupled receptor GRL101-like isoform X2 [Lytechinus variegatus]
MMTASLREIMTTIIKLVLVGMICFFMRADASKETSCDAYQVLNVRLATGNNASEGIVEVCVNGTRGHICGASWDKADADVVCSSLGFTRARRAFSFYRDVPAEPVSDEMVLYDVTCTGDESTLFECSYRVNLTGGCYLGEIAGIECLQDNGDVCIPGLCHGDKDMEDFTCNPLTDGCFILPWNGQLHCSFYDLGLFSLECISWDELGSSLSSEGIKEEERAELLNFDGNVVLVSIDSRIFRGFENLHFLYFDNNSLTEIQPGMFEGLSSLRILNLSSNAINYIPNGAFDGLESLVMLDLSYNPLFHIDDNSLGNLWNLEYLFLIDIYLPSLEAGIAHNLSSLTAVSASDSRICCLVSREMNNVNCAMTAPKSPLDTCGRLYPSVVLRIFGWIIGLTALVGNFTVLALRFRLDQKLTVQTLLIINLAVVDCLMGVYMMFVTSADVYFGDNYFLRAPWWRDSIVCKVAGFLAFLSSELSVLTLTLITLDRTICIVYPFGKHRMSFKVSAILLIVIWISVSVIGIAPFLINSSDIYGLSDVCLGLPLHVDSGETGILRFLRESAWSEEFIVVYDVISSEIRPSWIYSVVIFIGVNMVLFILMLVSYIVMFVEVKRSTQSVGNTAETRGREIKVARKMAFIVGTNFACWMPIIIMGILTQTGLVVLPSSLYAWVVIFILPINSSINPLIYTFMNINEKKRKLKQSTSNTTVTTISNSHNSRKDTSI